MSEFVARRLRARAIPRGSLAAGLPCASAAVDMRPANRKLTPRRKPMSNSKDAVRKILDSVKADKRTSLTAPEGKLVCDAYGIPVPKEGVAKSAAEAAKIATDMGFPVVMKIVSPDILHKTEAGGVMVGVKTAADAEKNYATILANAKKYKSDAKIEGIQIQQMLLDLDAFDLGVGLVFLGVRQNGRIILFGVGGGLHSYHHTAGLGLVKNVRRDDLHHHREAHVGRDLGGLGGGFGHALLRSRA